LLALYFFQRARTDFVAIWLRSLGVIGAAQSNPAGHSITLPATVASGVASVALSILHTALGTARR
jgi:hypothetical protein